VAAANADGVEAEPLRVASARELLGVGEPAEALELIAELDSSTMEVAAEAALLRSQAHLDLIRLDDARRELAAAAAAGTDDARLRVRIAMQKAALAARQGDYRATVEHAEEGIGIADSSAVEGREVADLYLWLGAARRHLGVPGARAAQERAVEIARRVGATELEFKAIRFLSFGLLLEGEAATAARISREAAERARSLRLLAWERDFQGWHAGYTWHLGEPALAASEAEAVLAEPISPELRESFEFYWWLSMADLGRGDEVRPFAEARVANAPEDNDGVGDTLWVLADIELAAGRPDVAERHAASYLDRFGRASTFVGVLRAWAQFEQGVLPAPAPGSQLPLVEAGPIEVDALVELFRGDAAAAAGGFDRAAALWQGRHVRGDIRCRWAAADALRCAGKIDEAKARLLLLEPEAERRQLNVLLRKIRRSLRLIGVPRAAARTSDGLLTGREREVLAFVAGGLTNDEIARRLGLGRPTVVRLIRSAQQKLGATSRTQAAALAARR
jgi:DNA-binding CsgD family transcriptional regulator